LLLCGLRVCLFTWLSTACPHNLWTRLIGARNTLFFLFFANFLRKFLTVVMVLSTVLSDQLLSILLMIFLVVLRSADSASSPALWASLTSSNKVCPKASSLISKFPCSLSA